MPDASETGFGVHTPVQEGEPSREHPCQSLDQHADVAEEWQARVDLAAVYRLVAHHGWDDVIYNHCSMRVPGEDRKFLMKQHELLWTEVTASNLVKVDMDEDLDERAGVNRPGFTLHGGVLRGRAGRQLRGARPHPRPAWRSAASRAGCG